MTEMLRAGETDARVLEALRVSDEASEYARKTEDLRCRALERVTVAEHCFQRTYLELLRLRADHAAAAADVGLCFGKSLLPALLTQRNRTF